MGEVKEKQDMSPLLKVRNPLQSDHCGCGHDHGVEQEHSHGDNCGCGHDHGVEQEHSHGDHCGCGHDHGHEHHEGDTHKKAQHDDLEKVFTISGLDCANCAAKIERHLNELAVVSQATVDFMTGKLILWSKDEASMALAVTQAKNVIKKVEPGVTITEKVEKAKTMMGDRAYTIIDEHTIGKNVQQAEKDPVVKAHQKQMMKIGLGALIFLGALLVPESAQWRLPLFLLSFAVVGGEIIWRATKNIMRGQVFDENFLMSIATIGAFLIGEYPEGVAVMLFYQVGELFQSYAVNRSRRSITSLMDIRPDYAHLKQGNNIITVIPEDIEVGDLILVKAGEKVPLDGVVVDGQSMIDTVALTGESVPRTVGIGDGVLSGCINTSGVLTIAVNKTYGQSTVAKILDLVENASSKKANAENFITKFARYYTPIVVIIATLLAVVPPLVVSGATFEDWFYRALVFLVISCPCALVISVPLSFFGGLGAASKCGVLIKGSNYLEVLANVEIAVFDKTGTLTKGVFQVTEIHSIHLEQQKLLDYAAHAESYSNHPISQSLLKAYGQPIDTKRVAEVQEISGHGVKATVDGKVILAGNSKLMKQAGLIFDASPIVGTVVHIAIDNVYQGYILIADQIKDDAKAAIAKIKASGVKQTVMLTGDADSVAKQVAAEVGIDQLFSELLPGDKVEKVEALFQAISPKGKLAFVGDGINDAPVLARADVGIAMGALGSDAAIEAADVVIMTDEPSKIATAMTISRKTLRIVKQNIIIALGIKLVVLLLGAFGEATMWEAVFADVGVSVIAILNAVRVLNVKNIE